MAACLDLETCDCIWFVLYRWPFLSIPLNEDIVIVAVCISICSKNNAHWSNPIIDGYISTPSQSRLLELSSSGLSLFQVWGGYIVIMFLAKYFYVSFNNFLYIYSWWEAESTIFIPEEVTTQVVPDCSYSIEFELIFVNYGTVDSLYIYHWRWRGIWCYRIILRNRYVILMSWI